MDITVRMLNGTSHTLRVNPQDTLGSLKRVIQDKLGVQAETQRLFVNGGSTSLSDDLKPISQYGLHPGATVSLLVTQLVTQPTTFQVLVRNEKGRISTYDIRPDETVEDLKKRIQCRETQGGEGIPVSQQRLIHQGREMTEGRLSDYNVPAMSPIDLNLRLRGGGGH